MIYRSELTDLELVDQVYYCLLDDSGYPTATDRTTSLALGAAVMIELIDNARLTVNQHGRLQVHDSTPPASALAHMVLEMVAAQRAEPLSIEDWFAYLVATDFATAVAERMVYRRHLRREERQRRFRGNVVDYVPEGLNRTFGPWLRTRLGRRMTGNGSERPDWQDFRLFSIFAALDLTGPLGEAAEIDPGAVRNHLPPPLHVLLDHLRTVAASAAMTTGT